MYHLKYENVSFRYEENVDVLKNVSFNLEGPQLILFKGQNGSGKSTCINLVFNVWKNYSGNIFLNGSNIKDISKNEISRLIGICFQKTPIFNDTIYNNITLSNSLATDEEVIKLCTKYNLLQTTDVNNSDFLRILENSKGLSGGQEQKIGIIRLLYKSPPIMIFDEPTSNLDEDSKAIFLSEIGKLKRKKLIIVISHDDEMVSLSDSIIDTDGWKEKN